MRKQRHQYNVLGESPSFFNNQVYFFVLTKVGFVSGYIETAVRLERSP